MKLQEASTDRIRTWLCQNLGFQSNKSFTLIELLIVIAIILILAAVSVPIYGNLQVKSQLNENSDQIIQTIRTARESSVSGVNNSSHGIYFEINPGADTYTLYSGSSYGTRDDDYDRVITLDNTLSFSTTLSDNDVNFSKGLGLPNNTGTITLSHDIGGTRTININSFGMIEEQ